MIEVGYLAILSVLAGLFVFSVIIVVHELGHFWVARACGVRVEAFSVGFGPTLFSWTDKHGIVWRIAAAPLGGYVKFFGDAGAASNPDRSKLDTLRAEIDAEHGPGTADQCFHFKPLWQRAAVVAAGPAANFVLAVVIFAVLAFAFGGRPQVGPIIDDVRAESPAQAAGLLSGDRIISADGREMRTFLDLYNFVRLRGGEDVNFTVERGGETLVLDATLGREDMPGFLDRDQNVGYLGVSPSMEPENIIRLDVGPLGAVREGVRQTWSITESTVQFLVRIVTGKESAEHLGGVLRIGAIAGDTAKQSLEVTEDTGGSPWEGMGLALVNLLQLAAVLSVGIGLLNLLPIPVLDGGHLLYYGYEAVAGRPMAAAAQEWGFRFGFALIIGLMIFVFVNDLRFFARI